MDMVQILKMALDRNKERVANVKEDQLGDRTHLGDWTVKDLLNHLIGGNFLFGTVAAGQEVDTGSAPDFVAQGPLPHTYESSVEASLAGWSTPGTMEAMHKLPYGAVPGKVALRIALMEAVVHGWDLAKATGQDASIPDELAAPMLSGVRQTVPPGDREHGPFGSEVKIAEDAPLGDQLVAYLGRRP